MFFYERYDFIDKLIKLGAKFDNLTQKAFYIIKLDGKLASLTPGEEMKFACLIGDFKKFVKLVNKGVQVKIGYINSMMKREYVPYFSINKPGIDKILNYLRDNLDKLDEIIHPKDHSKLEKIKDLLNVKRSGKRYEYPRGYKIYRILKFIDENHPKLKKDVVKFIVELTHGVGTFNPLTDASYWSDGFSIINPRIDVDDKSGEFRLNAKGKRDLKEMEAEFGSMNIESPV